MHYIDTSAAVKLVVEEAETASLMTWLDGRDEPLVSSDLLRTELLRATKRAAPQQMPRARAVLDSVTLLSMPTTTFERAAALGPDQLRSLDALHLASALELGDELEGIVVYDSVLARAARLHGMAVVAPG